MERRYFLKTLLWLPLVMIKEIKINNPLTLDLHKDGSSPTRKPNELQILKNYMPGPSGELPVRKGITNFIEAGPEFTFLLQTKYWLTSANNTTRVWVPGQGWKFPPVNITLTANTDLTVPPGYFDYWTPASPNTPTRTFTSADNGQTITAWYAPTPV